MITTWSGLFWAAEGTLTVAVMRKLRKIATAEFGSFASAFAFSHDFAGAAMTNGSRCVLCE